jgi:hypothetical protein
LLLAAPCSAKSLTNASLQSLAERFRRLPGLFVADVGIDLVSVEFFRGNQRLSPFCSRYSKGTAVPREKEQLQFFSPPFVKPVRNLTADDLFYKSAPTPAAGGPENREAELLARDFSELDSLISRREEWMASECLFTGKIKCLDGDTSEIVAELIYGTPSKTVPAKLWSDPTSDPLADLRGAMRLVSSQCGSSADLVIMGKNAADAFESNANVLAAYDKMRIAPGVLTAKNLSWGVQSLGTYRGVPLYVNESEYQDSDNSMKPFVPVDNVLIASSAAAGSFAYAGVPQVDQDERTIRVYEGARIPMISYNSGRPDRTQQSSRRLRHRSLADAGLRDQGGHRRARARNNSRDGQRRRRRKARQAQRDDGGQRLWRAARRTDRHDCDLQRWLGDGQRREGGLVSRTRIDRAHGRRRGLDRGRASRSRHLRRGSDHGSARRWLRVRAARARIRGRASSSRARGVRLSEGGDEFHIC